jgi:hypothetical protein
MEGPGKYNKSWKKKVKPIFKGKQATIHSNR